MELPARIAALREGPNRLALPFHGDAPFELAWAVEQDFDAFPELEDVEDELSSYLLLATALRGEVLLPILISKPEPHPVSVFFDGFHPLADGIDAFAQRLARPDPLAAAKAALRAGLEEASRSIDAGQLARAAEKLEEVLATYGAPPAAGEREPLGQELARGFTELGFVWHELGDDAKAAHAYELGAAHGSVSAGKNLLTMHHDAGDWARARTRAEALLGSFKNPEDLTTIRVTYALVLAALGDAEGLQKLAAEHVDYLKWLASSEVDKARALRDEFVTKLREASADATAQALIEPMAAALSQVPLVGKAKGPTERDIARTLEAIEKKQESKFKNWLQSKPVLAKDPRIIEAVDALSEPAASKFRAILRGS